MCGIAGFIGNPKHPKVTFDLINSLFIKTESRGEHASGFWCAMPGNDKRIVWHKEPVKASQFVHREIWRDVAKYAPNILLAHARYSSPGVGSEKVNKNNHPHVSHDCRVALVHNGRVPEYSYLKNHYGVKTDCDSEILLRIFESGEDYHDQEGYLRGQFPKVAKDTPLEIMYRLYGLRDIFSKINFGAMSVAVGERRDESERTLWLFHNKQRPLTLIDLRPQLGQIFFCSTPEIFRAAYDASTIAKQHIQMDQAVLELPEEFIYFFNVQKDGNIQCDRYEVKKKRRYGYWEHLESLKKDEEEGKVKKSESPLVRQELQIITRLDEDEDVLEEEKKSPTVSTSSSTALVPALAGPVSNSLDTSHIKHGSGSSTVPYRVGDLGDENDGDDNLPFGRSGVGSSAAEPGAEDLAEAREVLARGVPVKEGNLLDEDSGFHEVSPSRKKLYEVDDSEVTRRTYDDDEDIGALIIDEEDISRLETICDEAIELIREIKTSGRNLAKEQSIDYSDFQELLDDMEGFLKDLEGTKISVGL